MTAQERIALISDFAMHLCQEEGVDFIITTVEPPEVEDAASKLYIQTNIEDGYRETIESMLDGTPVEASRRIISLTLN